MPSPRLILRACRLALAGSHADPIPDYDIASTDYDDFFSRVMGVHSLAMLEQVEIEPGDDVIELACGTGHLTVEVLRRLENRGSLRAVDLSPGMLGVAREKVADSGSVDVTLEVGDMLSFLQAQPAASADVVICGWAICYAKPVRLLEQVARVLRPGGTVAVIESRADALSAMTRVAERTFAHDPSLMTGLVRISLPKDGNTIRRWFAKAGLVPGAITEGEQILPCVSPEDAIEWVERSGAAAGFRDSFDQSREDEVRRLLHSELVRYAEEHDGLRLTHTFVAGTARSQQAPVQQRVAAGSI
jgi:ubiquinone/menaquinone biosynthesis C-methylase UbiE